MDVSIELPSLADDSAAMFDEMRPKALDLRKEIAGR